MTIRWAHSSLFSCSRRELEEGQGFRHCPYGVVESCLSGQPVAGETHTLINRWGDHLAYGLEHELQPVADEWNEIAAKRIMVEGTKAEGL